MTQDELQGRVESAYAQEQNHTLHAFIDISNDLIAGTLLSQIIYWFTDDKDGHSKLRIRKSDGLWLAKTRTDWYKEIRISPKQYDRAVKILKSKGLVETKRYRFNNQPTTHIRPIWENLNREIEAWKTNKAKEIIEKDTAKPTNITNLPKGEIGIIPKVELELDERVNPLTENTTQTTYNEHTLYDNSYRTPHSKDVQSSSCSKRRSEEFDFNIVKRQITKACKQTGYTDDVEVLIKIFGYFYDCYYRKFNRNHFNLSQENIQNVVVNLISFSIDYMGYLEFDSFKSMIDDYFFSNNHFKNCNYSIIHFSEEGVLEKRFYKKVYYGED